MKLSVLRALNCSVRNSTTDQFNSCVASHGVASPGVQSYLDKLVTGKILAGVIAMSVSLAACASGEPKALTDVGTENKNLPNQATVKLADLEKKALKSGNTVKVGTKPGDAQCLTFGSKAIDFGAVTKEDWRSWMPGFRFIEGAEFLSVELDEDGNSVLRHKYEPSDKGSARVVMGAHLAEHRTYRLTETVFLEPGWEWGGEKYEGGKLGFGLGGGAEATGGTIDPAGFTARVMWRGNNLDGGGYNGTGVLSVYSYAADREKTYGDDYFFNKFIMPVGEWVQITYEVKANSSIDKSDGHVRAWVNGKQRVNQKNIGWQLAGETPVIDTFYYSSFYGGNSDEWAPSKPTYVKVKDVCWAPVVKGYSGINPHKGVVYAESAIND